MDLDNIEKAKKLFTELTAIDEFYKTLFSISNTSNDYTLVVNSLVGTNYVKGEFSTAGINSKTKVIEGFMSVLSQRRGEIIDKIHKL